MKKIFRILLLLSLLQGCIETKPLPDLAESPILQVKCLINGADTNRIFLSRLYPLRDTLLLKKEKPLNSIVEIKVDGESIPVFRIEGPGSSEQFGFSTPLLPGQTVSASVSASGTPQVYCSTVIPEPLLESDLLSFDISPIIPSQHPYIQKFSFDLVFRSGRASAYDVLIRAETDSSSIVGSIVPTSPIGSKNSFLYASFWEQEVGYFSNAPSLCFTDRDFRDGDLIHLSGSVSFRNIKGETIRSLKPSIQTQSSELYRHISASYVRSSNDFEDWGLISTITAYTNIENGFGYFAARSQSASTWKKEIQ